MRKARIAISAALLFLAVTLASCRSLDHRNEVLESNGESLYPPISYDGRYVAFYSEATNLVDGDTNDVGDVFVHDVRTGITTRVSVNSKGREGNLESTFPSISGNGRYVAFTSSATNLDDRDTNRRPDVFVHDRESGITQRVSISSSGHEANGTSYTYFPSISADGELVVFASNASNLVEGDTNGTYDIFVHDRKTGATRRVSVDSDGKEGNGPSLHGVIAGGGRYVAFQSSANNLVPGDTNGVQDVFVHDLQTGETVRVSGTAEGEQGDKESGRPAISHDGSVVAFSSQATNLVPNDTNRDEDVFVYERRARRVDRVNSGTTGLQSRGARALDTGEAVCCILSPACCVVVIILDRKSVISADGQHVVYRSDAPDLVPGDTNGVQDIFVFDRGAKTTTRVSVGVRGQANRESMHHAISYDGRYVTFSSKATNLVENDRNGLSDIFLYDRQTGTTKRVSVPSRRNVY